MKKTFLAITLLAVTTSTAHSQEENVDMQEMCSAIGQLAEVVMSNRQKGTALSEMMAIAAQNELARAVVVEAYDAPRMSVPENQARSIENFRNSVELECYQAFLK